MSIQLSNNDRISWLEMPAEAVEDERMRKLFGKAKEVLGFIPNVFLGFSIRPSHFSLWFSHFREVLEGESELSRTEREMIGVVVSSHNHCLYCLVSHGADLRRLLGDPVLGDRITLDYRRAGLDERTMAMLDYAVKITLQPVQCDENDIQRLRDLGFSDRAIFDIAEVAASFNFSNRMAMATGMMPNREYHAVAR